MNTLGSKIWRDIRPDAQAFDEVRITTVPRWKESELSGDEWRISAKVELLRKGVVVVVDVFNNVQTACGYLYSVYGRGVDDGMSNFAGHNDFCDQEGCQAKAAATYRKIANYCQAGHKTEPLNITIRRFCDAHKRRGDCGLDDADANYEPFEETL